MSHSNPAPRTPMDRQAKMLLAAILLWCLFGLLLNVYRFTVPTDGWLSREADDFTTLGLFYERNVMGMPSGLRPEDHVTAVNGVIIDGGNWLMSQIVRDAWQVGNTMQYTIQRDGQTLEIDVPLTRWEAGQYVRESGMLSPETLAGMAGLLILDAVCLWAFWLRPDSPAARALLVLAGVFTCVFLVIDLMPQSLGDIVDPVVNVASYIIIISTFTVLLPPAFIRLGLVYPRPKPVLVRHPWLAYVPYVIGAGVAVAFFLKYFVAGWLWTGASVLIALLLLVHSAVTMRDSVSRGQIRWALGGVILGLALFSLTYVNVFFVSSSTSAVGQLLSHLSGLSMPVIGVSLAVAILRYQLFDIDVIVNRALVYGGLTLSVIAIYVGIVGYLSFLFQTEANLAISLLATGVVAVLFGRLHGWLQRGVNRLMYGQRDDPYDVLTHLGEQLQTAIEPAEALQLTVNTIANSLKLPYVAIRLHEGDRWVPSAVYGAPLGETSDFPLLYAGETIGDLVVSARAAGESLNTADRRLLNDLAQQISPTAHASLLARELEQARLRIVAAREETRRRLGNDLHDGVGHQLTALVRQTERAGRLLNDDPAAVAPLLANVNHQLNQSIAEVRQLAYELHPPELELLGLVGALRERAAALDTVEIRVNMPECLPPLPAATETAVYNIAREALTNVEKHAHAHKCTVTLELLAETGQDTISLTVIDDGVGLSPSPNGKSGLGKLSMRARAAEVGGVCTVETLAEGGTAVMARIPYDNNLE